MLDGLAQFSTHIFDEEIAGPLRVVGHGKLDIDRDLDLPEIMRVIVKSKGWPEISMSLDRFYLLNVVYETRLAAEFLRGNETRGTRIVDKLAAMRLAIRSFGADQPKYDSALKTSFSLFQDGSPSVETLGVLTKLANQTQRRLEDKTQHRLEPLRDDGFVWPLRKDMLIVRVIAHTAQPETLRQLATTCVHKWRRAVFEQYAEKPGG